MYNRDILQNLSKDALLDLIDIHARNFLALDGVWFQSVERTRGMDEAMFHDTEAWKHYTVTEARRIKKFLGLAEHGGVAGLKDALLLRFNASVNDNLVEVDGNTVTCTVRTCRVQTARKEKGMPYHPCKPVGFVEYEGFAKTIDPRFTCECLSCFPDVTDETCCCKWRFVLQDESC